LPPQPFISGSVSSAYLVALPVLPGNILILALSTEDQTNQELNFAISCHRSG
jgi:hypothetical protein